VDQKDDGIFPLSPEDPPRPAAPSASAPPKPIPVYLPPPTTPATKPRGRSFLGGIFRYLFVLIFVLSLIINVYLIIFMYSGTQQQVYRTGKEKQRIALIDLAGTINMGTASQMRLMLKRAEDDDTVKAVILVVNSPGGYVAPSDMINEYIRNFMEKTKKKVYVSIQQVGASGAIWSTAPVDKIYAQENSIVGSVGVIYMSFVVETLMKEKLGVDPLIIKSTKAEFKDRGSPFRQPTEAEKTEIQNDLNNIHTRFVKAVAEGRKNLNEKEVWEFATGETFDGPEALDIKMIDKIGFLDDCIDDLAQDLEIKNPQVIRYVRPPTILELLTAKIDAMEKPLPLQQEWEELAKPPHIKAIWLGQ
jgi:protease IV